MSYHLVPVPLYIIGIVVYWIARRKNKLNVIAVVQPLNTVLGIHLFRKPIPMHFGPILYAGGQLLISLSPSYFSG